MTIRLFEPTDDSKFNAFNRDILDRSLRDYNVTPESGNEVRLILMSGSHKKYANLISRVPTMFPHFARHDLHFMALLTAEYCAYCRYKHVLYRRRISL